MQGKKNFLELIQKMVGETTTGDLSRFFELQLFENGNLLGYSQFNEILILLGFDRITKSFFQYLVDQKTRYNPDSAIRSIAQLEKGVYEFRKLAMLLYANIKFGFKELVS